MSQIMASPGPASPLLENTFIEIHPLKHISVICKNCQENVITTPEVRMGFRQWLCFWFPCVKKDWEVVHECPNCKFQVAQYINGKLHLNE